MKLTSTGRLGAGNCCQEALYANPPCLPFLVCHCWCSQGETKALLCHPGLSRCTAWSRSLCFLIWWPSWVREISLGMPGIICIRRALQQGYSLVSRALWVSFCQFCLWEWDHLPKPLSSVSGSTSLWMMDGGHLCERSLTTPLAPLSTNGLAVKLCPSNPISISFLLCPWLWKGSHHSKGIGQNMLWDKKTDDQEEGHDHLCNVNKWWKPVGGIISIQARVCCWVFGVLSRCPTEGQLWAKISWHSTCQPAEPCVLGLGGVVSTWREMEFFLHTQEKLVVQACSHGLLSIKWDVLF